jgi:riboflavin synthase
MFTGIVQGMGKVSNVVDEQNFRRLTVELPQELAKKIAIGASIANNGCCLTVTEQNGQSVTFDLMQETLHKTNLSELKQGALVNIERAAKVGDEIGGHTVSGHIAEQAVITDIIEGNQQKQIWFEVDPRWIKYVLHKGFVAIDGCSLTVGEVKGNRFCVYLIPETLERTCFGHREVNDKVNVEIDPQTQAIVDTVERVLDQRSH